MKTQDLQKLMATAKEQGYKLAALENANYERLMSFNNLQTGVDEQLKKIFTRLKSEVLPDGAYFVLFSTSIGNQKKADRYPVFKGKVNGLEENAKPTGAQPVIIHTKAEEVLTWDAALALHKEIADLKSEVARLKLENSQLYEKIEEYEEEEEEGLDEAPQTSSGSDIGSFLKETAPILLTSLDRYFDLQQQKLDLQKRQAAKKPIKPPVRPQQKAQGLGSQAHVDYMRKLFAENNDDALNAELDKIEATHPELYNILCTEFGMTEEEEEQENE